jgi:tricorn protease-like protein
MSLLWTVPAPAGAKTEIAPWLRIDGGITYLKIDPTGRYIVHADREAMGLELIEIKTRKVFEITKHKVGPSFFFSPDGYRVFYRELVKKEGKGEIMSRLLAYDIPQHKKITLEEISSSSSYLTFDPRDLRLKLLSEKGIVTRQIVFPDERLARWQAAQRSDLDKWLVTQQGVLWLTHTGYTMKKLDDDGSGIESFDIHPHGNMITWATSKGGVYFSAEGKEPVKLGMGRDPKWHPREPLIIYAGAHLVGKKIISYDIRMVDTKGKGVFVTKTQSANERWPVFTHDGKTVLFTLEGSTDIHKLEIKL